ncbi:MAG: cyclomaltodextrinase / maltogenic alpha-amylase / neopullulanase [Bacteroidales bacterium]|nr:cyclomaltodextrinase / maltogenic alpha-amylase / neopullulanase [Bacteroidales bacterium]
MKTKSLHFTRKTLAMLLLILIGFYGCNNKKNQEEKNIDYQKVKHPEWSKNASIYEVNIRQYTPEGTFNAFARHLPRLQEMGVDILWLMPIHPIGEKNRKGSMGSYYSVKNYLGINPEFGTEEDFKNLIDQIHELGMYVIIDWVANHTAWDNQLIFDHPEWYTKNEKGEIIAPVEDWTDVADLNYDIPEVRKYMADALIYWVKDFNIDGYRCDVAGMVPTDFWNNVRHELDKIKPVFMLAEANEPELHEYAFDMTYAWDIHILFNEIAQGKKNIENLVNQLEKEKTKYNASDYRMMFTSNHDENSWKGTVYERLGEATETFAVLSATLPGMPLIYNGQEACMNKQLRFFEKDTIQWDKKCSMDELYNTLLTLKENNKALWNGAFGGPLKRIATSADGHIFAFSRKKDDCQVITIVNLSDQEIEFELSGDIGNDQLYEIFTKEQITTQYTMQPWDYKVFSNT